MSTGIRNFLILAPCMVVGIWGGFVYGRDYPSLMIFIVLLLVAYVIYVLASNKQGAAVSGPELAAAKAMQPVPSKALIYIMRTGFAGGMQGMNVKIGDQLTGQIRVTNFMRAEMEPGTYSIYAKMNAQTEATAITNMITVASGDIILLNYRIKVGMLQGGLVLEEIRDRDVGIKKIHKLKMVDWIVS
jgi:hypothetical protein